MKPLLIYDGSCVFCLYWIEIFKNITKDCVEYASYQSVGNQFSEISIEQFECSIQLVKPDGKITEGAKAVIEALSYNRKFAWLFRIYQKHSVFAEVAETIYYFIARNRNNLSSVLRWFSKDYKHQSRYLEASKTDKFQIKGE